VFVKGDSLKIPQCNGVIVTNTSISSLLSSISTVDAHANDRCAADSNSSALEEEEEKKKNLN